MLVKKKLIEEDWVLREAYNVFVADFYDLRIRAIPVYRP